MKSRELSSLDLLSWECTLSTLGCSLFGSMQCSGRIPSTSFVSKYRHGGRGRRRFHFFHSHHIPFSPFSALPLFISYGILPPLRTLYMTMSLPQPPSKHLHRNILLIPYPAIYYLIPSVREQLNFYMHDTSSQGRKGIAS